VAKNVTEAIFNSRVNLYEDFPQINGIKYFDLQRKHRHYGRIDLDGDAVILDVESNIKQIFSGPTAGDQFAINFVSDAFSAMRRNVLKVKNSNFMINNGYFPSNLLVKKSQTFDDLIASYNSYLNNIYTNFVNNYLSIDRRAEKIKNYQDFVVSFMEYMLPNLKYFPITKTGFITSIHCSPFVSGLMFEIADETHGLGNDQKILNYAVDDFTNFRFYAKELKKFGFLMDRNAPWRFVFNLASGMTSFRKDQEDIRGAQIFMSQYGVNYDNVFPFYFRKAHREELVNMKNQLQSLYQSFYLQFPTFEQAKFTVSDSQRCNALKYSTERSNRPSIDQTFIPEKQHDEMILKVILKARLKEAGIDHSSIEFGTFTKEMLSNKRLFSTEAALNYINDLTKGFLVTKFNVKGDYWYGKSAAEYEDIKKVSYENAADAFDSPMQIKGSKNIQ